MTFSLRIIELYIMKSPHPHVPMEVVESALRDCASDSGSHGFAQIAHEVGNREDLRLSARLRYLHGIVTALVMAMVMVTMVIPMVMKLLRQYIVIRNT